MWQAKPHSMDDLDLIFRLGGSTGQIFESEVEFSLQRYFHIFSIGRINYHCN